MRLVFYGVLLTVFVAGAGYVQAANDQDYISISDESVITPKPSTGIAGQSDGDACGKGKQLCRDGFCRVSCESSGESVHYNDWTRGGGSRMREEQEQGKEFRQQRGKERER